MTRDEMKRILAVINSSYPNWKIENISLTIDTWFNFLGHYTYEELNKAVQTYVLSDTTGFAPSIGQINNLINTIDETVSGELNEMEAWSLVSKALRKSSWHSEEAYAELPPLVQKAVGSPQNLRNWATTDIDTVENVIMSNFQRTYRGVIAQAKQIRRMPIDIQQMIAEKQQERLQIEDTKDE